MAEYASNAKGNAALTTGIIGTSLGALASVGGVAGLLGVRPISGAGGDPGDRPVTKYELSLIRENIELKANQYAEMKADGLQRQISQQAVWNANQEGLIRMQAQQLMQLYGLTKLAIPNSNIMFPAPPPPAPPVATDTASGGAATAGG